MAENRIARRGPPITLAIFSLVLGISGVQQSFAQASRNAQPVGTMSEDFAKLSCKGIPMTC